MRNLSQAALDRIEKKRQIAKADLMRSLSRFKGGWYGNDASIPFLIRYGKALFAAEAKELRKVFESADSYGHALDELKDRLMREMDEFALMEEPVRTSRFGPH